MNRRALLAASASLPLAGCTGVLTDRTSTTTTGTQSLPTTIRAFNGEDTPHDLRVRVLDGDREAFSKEWSLRGADSFEEVVTEPGTYVVEVETGDGRQRRIDWRVRRPFGDVLIEFKYGKLSVVQLTDCDPACQPLSTGVEGSLPYEDGTGRLHYPADVLLESAGDRRAKGSLEIRYDGTRVAAGTYEIPPDMRLRVGSLVSRGTYRVAATSGSDRAETEWRVVDGATLTATFGDGVSLSCGPPRDDLHLYTDEEAPTRQVTVTAHRDSSGTADRVARQQFQLTPDTDRYVRGFLPGHGIYRLTARTTDGETETTTVRSCPPWNHPTVAVGEDGAIRVVQGRPA